MYSTLVLLPPHLVSVFGLNSAWYSVILQQFVVNQGYLLVLPNVLSRLPPD